MSRRDRRENRKNAEPAHDFTEELSPKIPNKSSLGKIGVSTVETLEIARVPESEDVPRHKRCPICFEGGNKGQGVQYSSYPLKRTKYFRCNKCGHTWSAVVEAVVTQINYRVPEDLSER